MRDGPARWGGVDGCGVAISEREILTVGHALKDGGGLAVELASGRRVWARVVRSLGGRASTAQLSSPVGRDLALLRVDEDLPQALPVAPSDPTPGTLALALGAPQGVRGVMAVGVVRLAVGGLVFGAPLEPGWSGGPLVSQRGEIVGLISRGQTSASLAVSAADIRAGLVEMRRGR